MNNTKITTTILMHRTNKISPSTK